QHRHPADSGGVLRRIARLPPAAVLRSRRDTRPARSGAERQVLRRAMTVRRSRPTERRAGPRTLCAGPVQRAISAGARLPLPMALPMVLPLVLPLVLPMLPVAEFASVDH